MRCSAAAIALAVLGSCTPPRQVATPPRPEPSPAARNCSALAPLVNRVRRGYFPGRSPKIAPIPRAPNYVGTAAMPVHTGPWDYLTRVPLLVYGPGLIEERGRVDAPATMADVAPTTGSMLSFDLDSAGGRPLDVADRPRGIRIVVIVVWDGVGMNVLDEHRRAWPYLRSRIRRGIWFERMSVGSTPSNTPPVHTTLGTGTFPSTHGIVHVKMDTRDGDAIDPFVSGDGANIEVPTLADLYDRHHRNRPLVGLVGTVNWHLGMIGHGRRFPQGDGDHAILLNAAGEQYGNEDVYSLPQMADPGLLRSAARTLDRDDGNHDGRWKDEDLTDRSVRYDSPAYVAYQQQILERTIARLGYGDDRIADLLFVNFKQADSSGHRWGMTSPQVAENVRALDRSLRRLVRTLDASAGRRRWVLFVTADHGQTPYPHESGGWPIKAQELKRDLEREVGRGIVERITSAGISVAPGAGPGRLDEIADYVAGYTLAENVRRGEVPGRYEPVADRPLFDAVLIGRRVAAANCGTGRDRLKPGSSGRR